MSDEEQGPEGQGKGPAEGGLGILFLAAAMGLVLILSLVGLVAYFAMSR